MKEKVLSLLNAYKDSDNYISRNKLDIILDKLNLENLFEFLIFLEKGFLFHGSSSKHVVLKPSKGNCLSHEAGSLHAVYASSSSQISIFFALINKNINSDNELTGYTSIFYDSFFYVSSDCRIEKSGFLHVLNKKDFMKLQQGNYVSQEKNKPKFILEIKLKDFKFKINRLKTKLNFYDIENIVGEYYEQYNLKMHGIEHIRRVVRFAKFLSINNHSEVFDDVIIGAYLHDIARINDNIDQDHAARSAKVAKVLLEKYWPNLNHKKIIYAIKNHSKGLTSKDPIIGIIWDADRLDLIKRYNILPNFQLISMPKTKQLIRRTLRYYNLLKHKKQ